jgi:hypothetical protein
MKASASGLWTTVAVFLGCIVLTCALAAPSQALRTISDDEAQSIEVRGLITKLVWKKKGCPKTISCCICNIAQCSGYYVKYCKGGIDEDCESVLGLGEDECSIITKTNRLCCIWQKQESSNCPADEPRWTFGIYDDVTEQHMRGPQYDWRKVSADPCTSP